MPSWARNVVRSTQTMHHHTRWRRVSPTQVHAELDIAPVGMPVRARGVGSIVELSPRKTRMTLTFHVRCRVPFLGPGVTRLFADQVREALRADHAFTLDYLAASAAPAHDRSR